MSIVITIKYVCARIRMCVCARESEREGGREEGG